MAPVRPRRVVALVGEVTERGAGDNDDVVEIRVFGSANEAGAGELRRLLASLKAGRIHEVRILLCKIGHSETRAIKQVCRKLGIPVRLFDGRGQVESRRRRTS